MRIVISLLFAGLAVGNHAIMAQAGDRGITPSTAYNTDPTDPQPFQRPELLNRSAVPDLMRWYYPASLRRARVGGETVATFTVDTMGVVDSSTIMIISTDQPALLDAARSVVAKLRFTPGRLTVPTSRAIPVSVTLPLVWAANDAISRRK